MGLSPVWSTADREIGPIRLGSEVDRHRSVPLTSRGHMEAIRERA